MRLAETLAIALAAVVALALVACADDGGEIERSGATEPPSEHSAPSDTAIAVSDAADRTPIEDEPGAVRWSDLLTPVDALDGSAIADAVVVHVASTGERQVMSLRAAVQGEHLEEGSLLAVDGPRHAARYFIPSQLPAAGESARTIMLSQGNTVTIEAVDEAASRQASVDITLRVTSSSLDEWRDGGDRGHAGPLLRKIGDEKLSADRRRQLLERALTHWSSSSCIGLDGPPPILRVTREQKLDVAELPHALRDLPAGWEFELVAEDGPLMLGTPDTPRETWSQRVAFTPQAQLDQVVLARCAFAMLSARVPPGATDVRCEAPWDIGGARDVVDEAGGIHLAAARSGVYELVVRWTERDGATSVLARDVHLEIDRVADLGELSTSEGRVIVLEPRVVVEGVRDASAEAALVAVGPWRFTLISWDHDYYDEFEQTSLAPRKVIIDGLKSLEIVGVSSPSREMRRAFAREGLELRRRPVDSSLDEENVTTIPIEFVCAVIPHVDLRITVPPLPGNVPRKLLGIVFIPAILRTESIEFADHDPDPSRPWNLTASIETKSDVEHEVTVVAIPLDRSLRALDLGEDAPPSLCAVRTFEHGDRRVMQVALELSPASAAVIHDVGASSADRAAVGVQPIHGMSRFADLYGQTGLSFKQCTIVTGLVPGARYRLVRGSDIEFVAPPAGQTLHLELHSR